MHWLLRDARSSDPVHSLDVRFHLLKALALGHLGQRDLARSEVALCDERTEAKFKAPMPVDWGDRTDSTGTWYDWWTDHILLKEVKSLLETEPNREPKETSLKHG
jgi:hypothetical protein